MQVEVLCGFPGCGKSEKMISEAAAQRGRYLFAVPTIALIEEQAGRFRAANRTAACVAIHSKTNRHGSVSRQIGELSNAYVYGDHVAVFITHEALMECDLSALKDWHARIDEPPNAITCGEVILSESVSAFQALFDLEPFDGGWSLLRPSTGVSSWKNVAGDSLWRGLTDFRKLAARAQGVYLRITDWSEAAEGPVQWFSLWTPLRLSGFATVNIAGAGFLSSVGYKLMCNTFGRELAFSVKNLSSTRLAQPQVRIMYFTNGHMGSTTFWDTSEGRKCLVGIERWIAANLPDLSFWSGNDVVRKSLEHRIPGLMVSPKLAGLNAHRDAQSCAIIYSSKSLPSDASLKDVFELTDAEIHEAREAEDIFQFVMRGAVRNLDYRGAYDIYLYSLDQAERLQRALLENGFSDVEVFAVEDAGLMDVSRPKQRRAHSAASKGTRARTPSQKAANALANRALRARKKLTKSVTQPLPTS